MQEEFFDSFGNSVKRNEYVQLGNKITNNWDVINHCFYDYSSNTNFMSILTHFNQLVLENKFKKLNETEICLYLLKN
jgi:hypothetical protein